MERINMEYRTQIDEFVLQIEGMQKHTRTVELQMSKLKVERDILATEKKSNTDEVDII